MGNRNCRVVDEVAWLQVETLLVDKETIEIRSWRMGGGKDGKQSVWI